MIHTLIQRSHMRKTNTPRIYNQGLGGWWRGGVRLATNSVRVEFLPPHSSRKHKLWFPVFIIVGNYCSSHIHILGFMTGLKSQASSDLRQSDGSHYLRHWLNCSKHNYFIIGYKYLSLNKSHYSQYKALRDNITAIFWGKSSITLLFEVTKHCWWGKKKNEKIWYNTDQIAQQQLPLNTGAKKPNILVLFHTDSKQPT